MAFDLDSFQGDHFVSSAFFREASAYTIMQSRPSLILHHRHLILYMFLINFLAASLLPVAAQEATRKREAGSRLQEAHRQSAGHRPSLERGGKQATVTLDSYLEEDAGYDILPGHTGQCRMNGITMFNGAVWSPRTCVTCICRHGRIACDTIKCEHSRCQLGLAQDTRCCATCANTDPDVTDAATDPSREAQKEQKLTEEMENHEDEDESEQQRKLWEERRREEEIEGEIIKADERTVENKKSEEDRSLNEDEQNRREMELKRKEDEQRRRDEEERRRLEQQRIKEEEQKRRNEERKKYEDELLRLEEEVQARWESEQKRKIEAQQRREERRRKQEEEQMRRYLEEEILARQHEEEQEAAEEKRRRCLQHGCSSTSFTTEIVRGVHPDLEEPFFYAPPQARQPFYQLEGDQVSLPSGCSLLINTLRCTSLNIKLLPLLQAKRLKYLYINENDINTVPPHIFDGLPNLEWMDLSNNRLTTRRVAPAVFQNLTFLRRLYLDNNQLSHIPHPLPALLEEIRINNNHLKVLDADSFQGLSSLVALELKNNRLSESTIDPQAFSPLIALTFLRLELNYFRLIPFGLPPSLEELYLDGNQIEEIADGAISPASMLGTLQLRNNSLKDEAISQNALLAQKNLESLDLSHNLLKHVPSYLPVVLRHLVLTHNQIERVPGFVFAHMKPGLQYLYLSFNQIDNSGMDTSSLFGTGHSLHELFLDYNKLQSVPVGLTSLKSIQVIAMNHNRISVIPDKAFCNDMDPEDSSLMSLRLENNYIERREIPHTAFSCIKSLSSVVLRPQNPIPKPDEHDQP
uniref:extracellular matrix protein 2-like isoform X2 n=1 Tax=Myxine glutinosa TaxID=7769 RepID=UPI00358F3BFD